MQNLHTLHTVGRAPMRWLMLVLFLCLLVPVGAQEGVGVVREGTTASIQDLNQFNPLLCRTLECFRMSDLLLPQLGYVDPTTARWEPAVTGTNTLAARWTPSTDARTYTITLRDGLTWADGTPVTAYDVLFAMSTNLDTLLLENSNIVGVAAPDERTLILALDAPSCSSLDILRYPVIPAHVFDPAFRDTVTRTITASTPEEQVAQWTPRLDEYDAADLRNHPFTLDPLPSNESTYTLAGVRVGTQGEVRLDGAQGDYAYVLAATPNPVESFIRGEVNYLHELPYERVGDVESVGGTVIGRPGTGVYALGLNFAAVNEPRSYDTDEEDGQGIHPVWGDRRVRQAAMLAIDVEPIIDAVFLGHGTPVAGLVPPGAWYAAGDLARPALNRAEAERLLTEAGWRDTNRDGVRECITCTTAPQGVRMTMNIGYRFSGNNRARSVADALADQLRAVGFDVNTIDSNGVEAQSLDSLLTYIDASYPYDPTHAFRRFLTTEDTIEPERRGENVTSYSNPQVDDLLTQGDTMPNCTDYSQRAAFYQEAQRQIVAEDIAYIPLFAPHDLSAVARGVRGFDPLPNAPQWNLTDWTVTQGSNRP